MDLRWRREFRETICKDYDICTLLKLNNIRAGKMSSENDTITGQNQIDSSVKMELYSIVFSSTMLCLGILFGGGGCVTVLIAMFLYNLMRKLRYILIAVLLFVCCGFDFIWCPVEISRLVLHHQSLNSNMISDQIILDLKYFGCSLYILLLCALAAIIVLISVQNFMKMAKKYNDLSKLKLGIIILLLWVLFSVSLTIVYVISSLASGKERVYHSINRTSFLFKIAIQTIWIILLLIPIFLMLSFYLYRKFYSQAIEKDSEMSDLHSTDNITVPTLLVKSVEELEEEEEDENSLPPLPSPDSIKESRSGSPASQSAMKKRSGSPSSNRVLFADEPSPTKERGHSNFGDKLKTQTHLGVNMAAILGRRRHTIAQISDPQLDLFQKAKTYTYVRKFSVDISALQAQLENPKGHKDDFPFHSQQDIQSSQKESEQPNSLRMDLQKEQFKRSFDEVARSQEIKEEPELNEENEKIQDIERNAKSNSNHDQEIETQSIRSARSNRSIRSIRSNRSYRDSICPTPPLISLTQSDGEEKQIELNDIDENSNTEIVKKKKSPNLFKLSFILVLTFILSILPMFITELARSHLNPNAYLNTITCTTSISIVQTMIYPQLIFCMDANINKAVHRSFVKARGWIMHIFYKREEVSMTEDISDTEV